MNEIHRRGCVIIRDVFKDSKMQNWNNQLEKYIEDNNYYEDQKKKLILINTLANSNPVNLKFLVYIGLNLKLKLDNQRS